MAQMKEQSRASERDLSEEEIANLSDGEFKALVIKMLTDLIEIGQKMKKTNEGYPEWNKAECSGNQQWQEGNQDSKQQLEQKEKINIHPDQNEETRILKSEETLTNLWDNLKCSNIRIIGVPEGEEEDQEIENLFEHIMKENFPNLAKEIDFQKSGKPRESKEVGPKKEHTKIHHH